MKTKKTKVVSKVSIDANAIIEVINQQLPEMIKDKFSGTYSNRLKDAIEKAFKEEEIVEEIKYIVVEAIKSVRKTNKFKEFIRESLVNKIIDDIRKNN